MDDIPSSTTEPYSLEEMESMNIKEEDIIEVIDLDAGNEDQVENEARDQNETGNSSKIENPNENEIESDDSMEEFVPPISISGSDELGSIFCGSLSRNGELAVTGSEDKGHVWNTVTNEIIINSINHKDSVTFAEFNYDDTYVAIGDMRGVIELWRLCEKKYISTYDVENDLTWMKWHHSINMLLAGTESGEIYVWQMQPDKPPKILPGNGSRVEIAVVLPDGIRLAVGYGNGLIRVFGLENGNMLCTISQKLGHSSTITAMDCYIDNNLMISASVDGTTIMSTTHNGKVVGVFQALDNSSNVPHSTEDFKKKKKDELETCQLNWVEAAAFCKNPGFPLVATGTINGEVYIWDISKQSLRHKVHLITNGVSKILWKGRSTIFFVTGLNGLLRCIEARTGNCIQTFGRHANHILDLYISEDERRALTTSDDGHAMVFDISFIH